MTAWKPFPTRRERRMNKRGPKTYYRFTEHNEFEGETWNFYLRKQGNEDVVAHIYELVKNELDYELNLKLEYTEKEVDVLVRNSDDGYIRTHNKIEKINHRVDKKPLKLKDLYKGGIRG